MAAEEEKEKKKEKKKKNQKKKTSAETIRHGMPNKRKHQNVAHFM